MSKPLSIFNAMFLHYESIKEPTEMIAKAILYKQTSAFRTPVIVILYSRGFYVKGQLNHVSFKERRSRSYQFVCARLLKNAFKIQFRDEFVLVIFHETIELVIEAMLLTFSSDSVMYCDNFLEYINTLITEEVCNKTFQSSVEIENIDKMVPNYILESDFRSIMTPMNQVQNIFPKRSELQNPSLLNSTSSSDKDQSNSSKEPIRNNEISSFFSKIKHFLERSGDKEEVIEAKSEELSDLTSSIEDFDDMINDYAIVSMAEIEMSFNAPFYKENKLLAELIEIENEKSLKTFSQKIDFDKVIKGHIRSISNEHRVLVWPEFLETETNFTSSLLVEMSFVNKDLTGNWSLTDKFQKNSSSMENKHFFKLEWDERVDRLQYNRYKKTFQVDKNGSILLYCCRQVTNNDVLN